MTTKGDDQIWRAANMGAPIRTRQAFILGGHYSTAVAHQAVPNISAVSLAILQVGGGSVILTGVEQLQDLRSAIDFALRSGAE